MSPIRNVVHASDFSPASRRAFATAVKLAAADRAVLTLVHVAVPMVPLLPEQNLDWATWERVNELAKRSSRKALDRLGQRAARLGVKVVTALLEGDAVLEIVRAARVRRADFLVIGTHGRRGFAKLLLGSVAERVIATASCPVVTVRGK